MCHFFLACWRLICVSIAAAPAEEDKILIRSSYESITQPDPYVPGRRRLLEKASEVRACFVLCACVYASPLAREGIRGKCACIYLSAVCLLICLCGRVYARTFALCMNVIGACGILF